MFQNHRSNRAEIRIIEKEKPELSENNLREESFYQLQNIL